ncbi:MAG: recombinase family protein, partial [Clostridia bacterium]|nr:recombinase family protein [Clostridia bacterium]
AAEVEAAVWRLVASWLNDPEALAARIREEDRSADLVADLNRVEAALADVRRGRENVLRALAAGLLDLDGEAARALADLKARGRRLEERKREIEAVLRRAAADEAKIRELCAAARGYLERADALPFEQRRELVRALVRRVVVSGRGNDVRVTVYAAFAPAAEAVFVETGRG